MSVRVQFGWSRGASGDSTPKPLEDVLTDNKAVCAINKRRATYANYDGLQGIVGKWNITFNKESMWWEFTIDVTAASTPVMTRPLEDFSNQCYCERTQQPKDGGESKKESMGTSPFRAKLVDWIENGGDTTTVLPPGVYSIDLNHGDRDQLGGAGGNWLVNMVAGLGTAMGINTPETTERYVTLGKLQEMVNDYSFSQTGDGPLMAKFDSTSYGTLSFKAPGLTSDPDIVMFPGIDDIDYDGTSADSCKVADGIDANKILINCIYANKCIEEIGPTGTIQDYFSALFRGVTDASGGLFELSVIDDGACDDGGGQMPTFSIIDLQKVKKNSVYSIPAGPDKAVLRDIKLDLELTDAMKSQALYGGTRQNANSSPCDEKRYKKILTGPVNKAAPPSPKPPKGDCPDGCDTSSKHKGKKPKIQDDYDDMMDEITEAKKETVRSRLVEEYNKNAENDLCKDVIVPFKFSFTTDGIGGIAFGQLISCDLIPTAVATQWVYQVTSVEQSINYGDWTTTVSTVARLK
jgi:hypothetical protein